MSTSHIVQHQGLHAASHFVGLHEHAPRRLNDPPVYPVAPTAALKPIPPVSGQKIGFKSCPRSDLPFLA